MLQPCNLPSPFFSTAGTELFLHMARSAERSLIIVRRALVDALAQHTVPVVSIKAALTSFQKCASQVCAHVGAELHRGSCHVLLDAPCLCRSLWDPFCANQTYMHCSVVSLLMKKGSVLLVASLRTAARAFPANQTSQETLFGCCAVRGEVSRWLGDRPDSRQDLLHDS